MTKYSIPDDHEWADEKEEEEQTDDGRPIVEVGRHTIQVDDNRDSHGYEHGLDWLFSFEEGVLQGYTRSHYLDGRTQSDYMSTPAWEDVPEPVKAALRRELRLSSGEEIPRDLPDFYGEEGPP